MAGISASAFETERIEIVTPGHDLALGAYVLHLDSVGKVQGPNFTADDAKIIVMHDGTALGEMHPERRFFPLQQQTTSLTAIRSNLFRDLYVALGDPDNKGGWTLRVYLKPLVPWIWLGAVIMAVGGMVSLSDRRWRVGAATRARSAHAIHAAPGE